MMREKMLRQVFRTSSLLLGSRGFSYSHAIIRELPHSFAEHAIRSNASLLISQERAKQQWRNYKGALESCGLKVTALPAEERNPDCVFVEDTVVVIGQKACLTQPGHPERRNEVEAVRKGLQILGLEIQELDDPTAKLDGGDVLFTGQEIFVGQSTRTNRAGAESLQRVFPEIPVTRIPIVKSLHLKSVASLAQDRLILVGGDGDGPTVLKVLQEAARGEYQVVHLEKELSANVLFINGKVVTRTEKELGSDFKKLTSSLTVPWIDVEFDELYKADGCLTCCSVLC